MLKAGGLGEADEEVRKVRAVPRVEPRRRSCSGWAGEERRRQPVPHDQGVDPSLEPGVTTMSGDPCCPGASTR